MQWGTESWIYLRDAQKAGVSNLRSSLCDMPPNGHNLVEWLPGWEKEEEKKRAPVWCVWKVSRVHVCQGYKGRFVFLKVSMCVCVFSGFQRCRSCHPASSGYVNSHTGSRQAPLICIEVMTNELWHRSSSSWETEVEFDGVKEKVRKIEMRFFSFSPILQFHSWDECMGNSKFFFLFVEEKRIQFISNISSMSFMHHRGVSSIYRTFQSIFICHLL